MMFDAWTEEGPLSKVLAIASCASIVTGVVTSSTFGPWAYSIIKELRAEAHERAVFENAQNDDTPLVALKHPDGQIYAITEYEGNIVSLHLYRLPTGQDTKLQPHSFSTTNLVDTAQLLADVPADCLQGLMITMDAEGFNPTALDRLQLAVKSARVPKIEAPQKPPSPFTFYGLDGQVRPR